MKIYFAGAIRGGRTDASIYQSLITYLSSFGEVLTKHVGDTSLSENGDDGPEDRHIYDRDMTWLSACDLLVAEVSVPSLGVGYELGCAVKMKKPVLCLYRCDSEHPLSAMIAGSPGIQTALYASIEDAKRILADFLKQVCCNGYYSPANLSGGDLIQ
ncbi:MAG: nucleoside 2-deoxyribosyltransferase [Acidobacteria bacterium]|nr:nucleoside 2-deoxyribosyltransferase [Acidobacteriota bacterium]